VFFRLFLVQDKNCLLTTTSRQDTLSRLNTVGLTQGRCHAGGLECTTSLLPDVVPGIDADPVKCERFPPRTNFPTLMDVQAPESFLFQ